MHDMEFGGPQQISHAYLLGVEGGEDIHRSIAGTDGNLDVLTVALSWKTERDPLRENLSASLSKKKNSCNLRSFAVTNVYLILT